MTNKNEWDDDVMKGAEYIKGFVDFVLRERAQLYGTLIHAMVKNGLTEIALPPIEEFRDYGKKYYILFSQNEDGAYSAKLVEQEAK